MFREAARVWREALRDRGFRRRAALSIVHLALCSVTFTRFVDWVERRPGVVLVDPVLDALPRHDLTWLTFGALYTVVPVSLLRLALKAPERLIFTLALWGSMLLLRIVGMWLTPLDPPAGIIPLADPFAQLMFGKTEAPLRDLFFSGHTSTLSIVWLTADRRGRWWALAAMAVVIPSMLFQAVHYTIDIVAAPFFVYGLYTFLGRFYRLDHLKT